MSHAIVDTHRLISDLKERFNFTDELAEGVSEAIRRIDLEHLATRSDIVEAELRIMNRIEQSKVDFLKWLLPLLIGQVAVFAALINWLH